jgi:hypothetical protein
VGPCGQGVKDRACDVFYGHVRFVWAAIKSIQVLRPVVVGLKRGQETFRYVVLVASSSNNEA